MKKIFVNGCFDILHVGHIRLLKYAKSLGDKLIVALDADEHIFKPRRPINRLSDRVEIVGALKSVDQVYSFSSEIELEELIKLLNVDILVVGSDWKDKKIVGLKHVGEVKYFERIPNVSTTETIYDICYRQK